MVKSIYFHSEQDKVNTNNVILFLIYNKNYFI